MPASKLFYPFGDVIRTYRISQYVHETLNLILPRYFSLSVLGLVFLWLIICQPTPVCAEAAACKYLDRALKIAQDLRKLQLKSPVDCQELTEKEFSAIQKDFFSEDLSAEALYNDGLVYKALGIISEDYQYQKCLLEDSLQHIQALYHAESKRILIPKWQSPGFSTLIHESVHVLQDQHFDLWKLKKEANTSTDSALSFAALVEGDAVEVERKYRANKKNEPLTSRQRPTNDKSKRQNALRCKFPDTLAYLYEFPYNVGRIFVGNLKNKGGYSKINEYLRVPPSKTSDILYSASKKPHLSEFVVKQIEVQAPKASMGEWKEIKDDMLGEYFIRTMLRPVVKSRDAIIAGIGWRGDKIKLFEAKKHFENDKRDFLLLWHTEWKNEVEQKQFTIALLKTLQKTLDLSPYKTINSAQISAKRKNGDRYKIDHRDTSVVIQVRFSR